MEGAAEGNTEGAAEGNTEGEAEGDFVCDLDTEGACGGRQLLRNIFPPKFFGQI